MVSLTLLWYPEAKRDWDLNWIDFLAFSLTGMGLKLPLFLKTPDFLVIDFIFFWKPFLYL